jgi:hypothetical protein
LSCKEVVHCALKLQQSRRTLASQVNLNTGSTVKYNKGLNI